MDRFIPRPIMLDLRSTVLSWQTTVTELCLGSCVILPLALLSGVLVRRCSIVAVSRMRSRFWRGVVSFLATSVAGCGMVLWSPLVVGWRRSDATSGVLSWQVFTLRLGLVWLGTFLGERFTPVALTGSIATGKSTVAQQLTSREPAFHMVDADSIGHQILLPPHDLDRQEGAAVRPSDSVYQTIVTTFGSRILDTTTGQIERRKLGDVIFKDRTLRRKLNAITHPKIIYILLRQLVVALYFQPVVGGTVACADVPLLFESGQLRWLFAITIVVACDPSIQLARLRQRNSDLSEAQCRERIDSQLPVAQKVQRADLVVWNNSDREHLSRAVERVRRECRELLCDGSGGTLVRLSNAIVVVGALLLALSYR